MRPGPKNLITDIEGLAVGNAHDARIKTGTTVLVCARATAASVAILGGAPGTRDVALLEPEQTVGGVDALVLSGGSAFGLDAPGGAMARLAAAGRGFAVGTARVPIVPGAILFDLLNGGDKDWGDMPPYRDLGAAATDAAATDFALGKAGAGYGATTAGGIGGLGSASSVLDGGITVGALVAVNAIGSATVGDSGCYWAAPFEIDGEFGGRGLPPAFDTAVRTKGGGPNENTTIGIVATDAALDKARLKRLAIMAHDGYARALWPAHTPFDGDLIFAVSTGKIPLPDPDTALIRIGAAAAATMARAVARGVHEARR
ncbi:MAG: P1 family peptidase [Rhodobiaceae bacterium]|nr:P1 family peptidase [Rhodobiaceae bacterium]